MYIIKNNIAKNALSAFLILISTSLLSGCVTQSFENNEPIVKSQANRDEMAATRISLGLGYLKMGDMPQAKLNLEKAKAFSPQLVQVHTAFAHYYETVGENTLAVESFEAALVLKEDSADTLNNYGVFLCRQGDVEAAEVQFLKAIAVPSYLLVSESYENLASCYLQNNDFDKAEMYLKKSIYHSPNRTSTLLQMVRLQYAMEDYKEAKRYLGKFERNTQRFTADSLSIAYKVYWKLGQRRTAGNYGNMLVKMYPQSWEGKQYLLNGLEYIAADDLARRYQSTQKAQKRLSPSTTKRVVKLSPKSSKPTSMPVSSTAAKSGNGVTVTQNSAAVKQATVATTAVATTGAATSTATTAVVGTTATATKAVVATTAVVATALTTTDESDDAKAVIEDEQADAAVSVEATEAVDSEKVVMSDVAANEEKVSNTSSANAVPVQTTASDTVQVAPVAVVLAEAEVTSNTGSVVAINAPVESNVVTVSDASELEPTSTQPIAAQRDVPLPEPIIEPIPEAKSETIVELADEADKEIVTETQVTSEQISAAQTSSAVTEESLAEEVVIAEAVLEDVVSEEIASDEATETAAVTESVSEEVSDEAEKVSKEDAMHTVVAGQNLYNISVKYNVRLKALRKWNNISENNNIRIGQKLYVVDPQTVQMN